MLFQQNNNCTIPQQSNYKFKTMSSATTSQINSELSIYIPHVFPNFTTEYIAGVFETLDLGRVDHIDFVAKQDKNGKNYNAAYVHFAEWFDGPATEHFQERVINPNKEARIIHDEPWYWIVLENNAKKFEPGARKQTLDLSEESNLNFVEIASDLSPMSDEIDTLIAECYNSPIDDSCEVDNYVYEELDRIKEENNHLKQELTLVYEELHRKTMEYTELEMELQNANYEKVIEKYEPGNYFYEAGKYDFSLWEKRFLVVS